MLTHKTSLEQRGYKSRKLLKECLRDGVFSRVEIVVRKERPSERFVAKVLKSSTSSQEAELLSEFWFLENLKHPCLVQCIERWDSGLCGEVIIMEFAEHGDTRQAVKSMKKAGQHLHGEVVRLWLHQMLQGLAYIHSKHVIHRDLKTANVFLTNQWRRSLIGDFGEAVVRETPAALANDCVGTPYYMSPEMMEQQQYNEAVDMWAVGVICYELMALQRPFECKKGVHGVRDRLLALAFQIVKEDPDTEPLHRAGYSDTLIHLVIQMLAKNPTRRPEPARLLKDPNLWNNFNLADSEWLAADTFAISEQARVVERHRTAIPEQTARIPTKDIKGGAAQLPEVNVFIPVGPSVVLSKCSSPSIAAEPSSPSTASGSSSPSSASRPSTPSNASRSSGWASILLESFKKLKAEAITSSKSVIIQALLF
eukprot:gnl/MRDRNA2_/MRDRNA2_86274_c0_seq1.p1 gnl/MRDRNA2_/MRDRNA2_86274_c0~~gnl/MRDRNA2_/MRDRNA2_86274_c0_seq1.p1  ORF type:complete len:424 (-),score=58.08 gnl/MRDRNA2_/MRDRNA2_86274_c0_seq1:332-1603(-)